MENRNKPGPKTNKEYNRTHWKSTGPKTEEGKLRMLVSTGNVKDTTDSKILRHFRKCDLCPLRPRIEKRIVAGQSKEFSIASKCPHYREGRSCIISQSDFAWEVNKYFKEGKPQEAVYIQQMLTREAIKNMQIATETEILQKRTPGFYSNKWHESAVKSNEITLKYTEGEKLRTENKNLNVNVDLTDAVISAWKKAKNHENKENEE